MKQIAKTNEAVGMKYRFTVDGGGKGLFVLSKGKSYGNALITFYHRLPMGINYTSFGLRYQNIFVTSHLLN